MAQETIAMRGGNMGSGFLTGIERTLRMRGTLVQRILCAAMMAILSFARLPGGGYCCQGAMFAVLLRQGFCVPAGFAGVMLGFAAQYAARGVGRLLAAPRLHDALAEHGALGETGQSDDDGGSGFSDPVDGCGGDGRWKWV